MKSMTGYGEASRLCRGVKITVQMRSLNHRHLDLQLRVPREYLAFEEEMRKDLRDMVGRGRIELFVNRSSTGGQTKQLDFDDELVGQYVTAIRRLKRKFGLAGEVEISLVAAFPELFGIREAEVDAKREKESLFKAFSVAMKKLERSKVREGTRLKSDMDSQIRFLRKISLDLERQTAQYTPRVQKNAAVSKDVENVPRVANESYEVGNWVIKGDVNEEVVRLKSHIGALSAIVGERQPVGKKIDFILQEVQRELNTISSKLPHLPVVQLVLQGKERVEKIREQTQNVE